MENGDQSGGQSESQHQQGPDLGLLPKPRGTARPQPESGFVALDDAPTQLLQNEMSMFNPFLIRTFLEDPSVGEQTHKCEEDQGATKR
jgi:hypothetical protein